METYVSIKKLSKVFGSNPAVSDVSFSVSKGEILGFLGPNGAGKTTTMRMITGYMQPTSGEIYVCGTNIQKKPLEARQRIGYLPEGAPLYSEMTPYSFLKFIGEIRGLQSKYLQERMDFVIDKLQLSEVLKQNIETLSKGFKRRVALAQAIIHDPKILILDEPTDGLDPNQKYEVHELISSMAKDKAIIISTHILEEVDTICNKAIIISKGKVLAAGTTEYIRLKGNSNNSVVVKLRKDPADRVLSEILKIKNVNKVKMNGERSIIVYSKKGNKILEDVSDCLFKNKYQIEEIYSRNGTLDEAFRELTTEVQEVK